MGPTPFMFRVSTPKHQGMTTPNLISDTSCMHVATLHNGCKHTGVYQGVCISTRLHGQRLNYSCNTND